MTIKMCLRLGIEERKLDLREVVSRMDFNHCPEGMGLVGYGSCVGVQLALHLWSHGWLSHSTEKSQLLQNNICGKGKSDFDCETNWATRPGAVSQQGKQTWKNIVQKKIFVGNFWRKIKFHFVRPKHLHCPFNITPTRHNLYTTRIGIIVSKYSGLKEAKFYDCLILSLTTKMKFPFTRFPDC